MIILQIILLIILGFILLILFAPFKYSALVFIKEKINTNLFLDWVIFKVEFLIEEKKPFMKVYILGKLIKSISPTPKKVQRKNKSKREKTEMPNKEFFVQMFSLGKEVFKVIKPKEFIASGTYGFEDPSITGILNLVLVFIAEVMPWAQIDLNPVYEEEAMWVNIRTYGRVSLIILIYLILKYVFKKEVRKVLFHKSKKN
jgi:hypothetical protein